jgi:hypothetical protein
MTWAREKILPLPGLEVQPLGRAACSHSLYRSSIIDINIVDYYMLLMFWVNNLFYSRTVPPKYLLNCNPVCTSTLQWRFHLRFTTFSPLSGLQYSQMLRTSWFSLVHILNVLMKSLSLNWYSGGVESNWVYSVLRPPIGLLCQPWVIMMKEKLVEWWLTRETEVLGEILPLYHFVHHKLHMLPGREPG